MVSLGQLETSDLEDGQYGEGNPWRPALLGLIIV